MSEADLPLTVIATWRPPLKTGTRLRTRLDTDHLSGSLRIAFFLRAARAKRSTETWIERAAALMSLVSLRTRNPRSRRRLLMPGRNPLARTVVLGMFALR